LMSCSIADAMICEIRFASLRARAGSAMGFPYLFFFSVFSRPAR
jgi:hypothetical protein